MGGWEVNGDARDGGNEGWDRSTSRLGKEEEWGGRTGLIDQSSSQMRLGSSLGDRQRPRPRPRALAPGSPGTSRLPVEKT